MHTRPYTINARNPRTGQFIKLEFITSSRAEAKREFAKTHTPLGWQIESVYSLRQVIAAIAVGITLATSLVAGGTYLYYASQPHPPQTNHPS